MKIVYLKNQKKEIVFSEIVKKEEARDLKIKLMADKKFNGCSGFIVNLDSIESTFRVVLKEEENPKRGRPTKEK